MQGVQKPFCHAWNHQLFGLRSLVPADAVYIGVIHPYHLRTCLIFTNAKKNVLCEKPLAMNGREVQEILESAKKNNVFLMEVKLVAPAMGASSALTSPTNCDVFQAVWTRFFPASAEVRRLLAQGEVGPVKYVRSDFCVPILHVERSVKKELGAGAMLDVGIYCLQFILMVFDGEKPESVQATATCLETGESVDPSHTTAVVGRQGPAKPSVLGEP